MLINIKGFSLSNYSGFGSFLYILCLTDVKEEKVKELHSLLSWACRRFVEKCAFPTQPYVFNKEFRLTDDFIVCVKPFVYVNIYCHSMVVILLCLLWFHNSSYVFSETQWINNLQHLSFKHAIFPPIETSTLENKGPLTERILFLASWK